MKNKEKLKTLIPLNEIEQGALDQIEQALNLPFLKKLAIMPDCHQGYSLPIGGVALLDNVISPEYVGYDVGCGMTCIVSDERIELSLDDKKEIEHEIRRSIPTGFYEHKLPKVYKKFVSACGSKDLNKKVEDKLLIQLGTLGGGNHFIEIGESMSEMLSITIHSGSRKVGHIIATHYMKLAKNGQIANGFFDLNSEYGQMYLQDMLFAQDYALENRKKMMEVILDILGFSRHLIKERMINENHNHAIVLEGGDVLHRKGATSAELDQYGVIPGNMKDGTYITVGLGNEEYLKSASHGAGRKMSRRKAKESLVLEDVKKEMEDIVINITPGILDEARGAYKDIDRVIEQQDGIVVDVIDHIKPLIVIKGEERYGRKNEKAEKVD